MYDSSPLQTQLAPPFLPGGTAVLPRAAGGARTCRNAVAQTRCTGTHGEDIYEDGRNAQNHLENHDRSLARRD